MTAPETTRPVTARVRLARTAERVVEIGAGVTATAGRGRRVTLDGARPIQGVVAAEAPGGRVDIQLHLVVATPTAPLAQTADLLRAAIVGEARRAGLADRLGSIDIAFEDLAVPDEGGGPR